MDTVADFISVFQFFVIALQRTIHFRSFEVL